MTREDEFSSACGSKVLHHVKDWANTDTEHESYRMCKKSLHVITLNQYQKTKSDLN